MDRADLIGGAGLALFGLLMIFVLIPLGTEEGAYFGLSPTLFPTLLSTLLTVCALGQVAQSLVRIHRKATARPIPVSVWNLLMFLAASLLALGGVILIDWFGMLIGGPALIAILMIFLGERNPLRIILTATLPVGLVYLLAIHVLGTAVP
jgi:hypothetical protein